MALTLSRIRSQKMRATEDCPVCSTELREQHATLDEGTISEHYAVCPKGCYSYEYSYGYTTVQVTIRGHNLMFGWSYSDDKQTTRAESDAINTALEAARHAQVEDLSIIQDADQTQRS